jgi:hypothetical protein
LLDIIATAFGYNTNLELQYRGQLDASRKEAAPGNVKRDLLQQMQNYILKYN